MMKRKKSVVANTVANPLAKKLANVKVKKEKKEILPEEVDLVGGNDEVQRDVKEEPNFNVYVGTELGILKGVSLCGELPISKSLFVYRHDDLKNKPPPVTTLTWVDENEKELLVCFSNHVVKTYNTKLKCFSRQTHLDLKPDNEKVVGLCCHDSGNYVVGLEGGTVSMWNCRDSEVSFSFKTCQNSGGHISDLRKIRQCPSDRSYYATGGKENDLKIWNLSSETPSVPVFKAKNVPHDELDLRVPIWIEDLTFLPRTSELVAVGTRYGQIRLYDVRANPRPVSNVKFADNPIMSITSTMNDRQVIVGTGGGETGMYDLRNPGKEKLLLKYFGPAGSVRSVLASSSEPYFLSCGLDRHLYVFKLSERKPVKKLYMSQQLNCLAISKSFTLASSEKDSSAASDGNNADISDWANIPPDVLFTNDEPIEAPIKKLRKSVRS